MHPWMTGRIIETMQHEARARGDNARLGHVATHRERPRPAMGAEPHEPRRERLGLAVARFGLRLARRDATLRAPPPALAIRNHDADQWSNPWTTCGATSTSPH